MDAIEFNHASSTMGAMAGLRKLGNTRADAAGRAAASPEAGGLSIGRRLVVMVNPQPEGQLELEEGDFRRASPLRSSRGLTDGAGVSAAVKPGMVQVVDHGVQQKEAVRRLFEAHVMVASLEEQLTEKELLIRRLSQQLNKVGLDEGTAQPEQSTKPVVQPVHIEVVHEVRSAQLLQSAAPKPAHVAQVAKPARLAQPDSGPSQMDKRRLAQERVTQEESAQSGVVRKGFPKWLTADETSRQVIDKVWSMMLSDWNAKNTFEKSNVVQTLWHCGFEFAMRWGGDPNELLQEQIAALTAKYARVQRESQKEIAMLRQHARRTEVQYKNLQDHCQKLRLSFEEKRADAAARQSSKSLSSTGELSREQSGALVTPAAGSRRKSLAPPATPSQSAAPSPSAASTPSRAVKFLPELPEAHGSEEPGPLPDAVDEAKRTGNREMVEDDTLMVSVAERDLEAMDHEVFESIRNMDADQQELMVDMVNDKVRRILALDPSKWTDGRLPFGLRPDSTPPDVIKLEAENRHLRGQLIEAEQALEDTRKELEAARQVRRPLEPAGNVNKFVFQKAVRSTLSLKAVSKRRVEGQQPLTAGDAEAKKEDETEDEDDVNDRLVKVLKDEIAELEAKLRAMQEELSKARAQASLARQQLAQKDKELKQRETELKQREMELKERLDEQKRLHDQQMAQREEQLRAEQERLKAEQERLKAELAERSKAGTPGPGAGSSTRATTASSSSDARSFWVEVDQSTGQARAGVVVSKQGPPPALRVESIDPGGRVAEWNRLNPGATVAEGDLIVEINGVAGDGDALMRAFEEHGLLRMRLHRDPGFSPRDSGVAQPKIAGSRTAPAPVLAQVPEEKNVGPTIHQEPATIQKQSEVRPSRGNDERKESRSMSSRGTQCEDLGATRPSTSVDSVQKGEALPVPAFENWIDELMPAPSVSDEELNQLRQRCKSQEDEIARLVLIIDELRTRMGKMLTGGEATPELTLQVGGLMQKVGLKEVVDARGLGDESLPAVFRRLYQDSLQRIQRFAIIRESVKAVNKAVLAACEHEVHGVGPGGAPPPDLEHLHATAAAALSGMWYHSDYTFKRMCDYATSQGIEAIAKAHTTSLAELLGSAPGAEDTDAAPPASEPEGVHGRLLCTPPKATLERLPGRRSERVPRTSGHPLQGGLAASDGLVAKLSRGAGDRARSPRSRQQRLRQAQLADPEPTSFTCYMATMKEARGDLQDGAWARAARQKPAAGEGPPRAAALGEGPPRGLKAVSGSAPRSSAQGGLQGAQSMPALPRIRTADATAVVRAQAPL